MGETTKPPVLGGAMEILGFFLAITAILCAWVLFGQFCRAGKIALP
jgi:hypothetical protein